MSSIPTIKFLVDKMNIAAIKEKKSRIKNQNFDELRKECLDSGTLFEDPEFPADNTSLFDNPRTPHCPDIIWKRPTEIVEEPQFYIKKSPEFEESSEFKEFKEFAQFKQGMLGDCWLLAPITSLTYMHDDVIFKVVPEDQDFNENYAGIFHFKFWHYGDWIDVVIDDRLPTFKNGRLLFINPGESKEFWSALLEKAYAKLHGTYSALVAGNASDAMEDFTGGLAECYFMDPGFEEGQKIQFNGLLKAFKKKSMICCSTRNTLQNELPENPQLGLPPSHQYCITCIKCVTDPVSEKNIPLLRLRNPHGDEFNWDDRLKDSPSYIWRFVPDYENIKSELTFDSDGEFWITLANFERYFKDVDIWNTNLDSLLMNIPNVNQRGWKVSMIEGEWVCGVTAGGFIKQYFGYNPQYLITLEEPDEGDDTCTVIVALMQKNNRELNQPLTEIGFVVYPLDNPESLSKPIDNNFFSPINFAIAFLSKRESSQRFKLLPGTYCIIPTTNITNIQGEFLLRIISEKKIIIKECDVSLEIDDTAGEKLGSNLHEDELLELFQRFAGDDEKVDFAELKLILDISKEEKIQDKSFTEDICRNMFALLDTDNLGKLGFEEFKSLWNDVRKWRAAFSLHDPEGFELLRPFKLREALSSAGYKLNNHILNILGRKYSTWQGFISYDDFIMCAVHAKMMFDYSRELQAEHPENTDSEILEMMKQWIEKKLFS